MKNSNNLYPPSMGICPKYITSHLSLLSLFGEYTTDKMIFILPCKHIDPDTGEISFSPRYINRKWQLKYTRNAERMVREGLFTYHRSAGSSPKSKKYMHPGNSYLCLTEKGIKEYYKLEKMLDKKRKQHLFH